MTPLGWTLAATAGSTVLGLAGGAVLLAWPRAQRLLPHLVSYAAGAMLGAAFIGLLPQAIGTASDARRPLLTVLGGIYLFFLLDRLVIWHHCHTTGCAARAGHPRAAGALVLAGDAVHNLADGVLIGAAFMGSTRLGLISTLAILAHEIPQELGDFAVLLDSGYRRSRALLWNALSGLTAVAGGVAAVLTVEAASRALPYIVAVAAASFLYIPLSDLLPTLHRRPTGGGTAAQAAMLAAGSGTLLAFHRLLG